MPREYRIRFLPIDRTIPAEEGENLLEIAMKAGVHINASCGGRGACGKCRVRIADGSVESSPHSSLSEKDEAIGFRLACRSSIKGDAIVEIPLESQVDRSILRRSAIVSDVGAGAIDRSLLCQYGCEALVGRYNLLLSRPDIQDNVSDAARLMRCLAPRIGCEEPLIPLSVMRALRGTVWPAAWDSCLRAILLLPVRIRSSAHRR